MNKMRTITSKVGMVVLTLLASVVAYAQDKKIDVNIGVDKGDSQWYAQPWVWIVGGAVFILLLVAMLRGGKKD